jgi:hypothetical protein
MWVETEFDLKSAFNVGHSSIHIHQHSVGVGAGHGEAIRPGERDDGLVLRFSGTESFRELFRSEVLMKAGISGVVEPLEKVREFGAIPQRQSDGQMQMLRGRQPAYGLQPCRFRPNVASNDLPLERIHPKGQETKRASDDCIYKGSHGERQFVAGFPWLGGIITMSSADP